MSSITCSRPTNALLLAFRTGAAAPFAALADSVRRGRRPPRELVLVYRVIQGDGFRLRREIEFLP